MATQELEQGICQKYGWSAHYFKVNHDSALTAAQRECWAVEVSLGMDCKRTFISNDKSTDSRKGRKQGRNAAARIALEGLQQDVQRQEEKPVVSSLCEAVSNLFSHVQIKESADNAVWQDFWRNPPKAVGIDTEGNSLTPPVLIQVATNDIVILECPAPSAGLSTNLQRLLNDASILKVLCDSPSQKDAKSLGISFCDNNPRADIENLEQVASNRMGPTSVPRGLSNLLTLVIPELNVRIAKESAKERLNHVRTFTAVEQGYRPRPHHVFRDLTPQERRYAAVDAWCTLLIWQRLQ